MEVQLKGVRQQTGLETILEMFDKECGCFLLGRLFFSTYQFPNNQLRLNMN